MTVALVVAIVGLLIYALIDHPKLTEVGRILFFVGLLVVLLAMGGKVV